MPDSASSHYQVTVTAPSLEEAEGLAAMVVSRRLAACAQVLGPVVSTYWWQGEVATSQEWMCLLKTTGALLDQLTEVVEAAHSYEVPEVVALPVVGGSRRYLEWVDDETRGSGPA